MVCILLIVVLATGVWERFLRPKAEEQYITRVVTPRDANLSFDRETAGQIAWEESLITKAPMEDGETIVAVLTIESEEGFAEEQIAAYRNSSDAASPVYITRFSFDNESGRYKRLWNVPTAATRPETISLYIQDLIGNRNNCIIVTGINDLNEHTMTIFMRNSRFTASEPYKKIAELQIDGSIVIQETGRTLAYQQGITSGRSFTIAAYGHDSSSDNIMDQLETIYAFNPANEQYERINVSRIPGSQIEQRRLREILSGNARVFENFVSDLWYYVSPQGTIDQRQYLYFNSTGRSIIFFSDETQQIFQWQNSTSTRYGIYIRSQNISISTLLRFIDIELESLDSIKLRVNEDVKLKITASTFWDGTYRRAGTVYQKETKPVIKPAVGAVYDSPWGRLQFHDTGEYTLTSGGSSGNGRYVFFTIDENELLELRPEYARDSASSRMIYKVDTLENSSLMLSRVRIGTTGIHNILEPPVTLIQIINND